MQMRRQEVNASVSKTSANCIIARANDAAAMRGREAFPLRRAGRDGRRENREEENARTARTGGGKARDPESGN